MPVPLDAVSCSVPAAEHKRLSSVLLFSLMNVRYKKTRRFIANVVFGRIPIQCTRNANQTYTRRFAVAGPTFWNSLADKLRTYSSDRFKLALKTFLFALAYSAH